MLLKILISTFILTIFSDSSFAACGCNLKDLKAKNFKVGDMIISKTVFSIINGFKASTGLRWPNKVVKYTFESLYPENLKDQVRNFIREYEKELGNCVKFTESTDGSHAIIKNMEGCSSSVGYNSFGRMEMTLPSECVNQRSVKHEFSHLLGFMHEHSRPDRDEHVDIYYENVDINYCENFHICDGCATTTDYDFFSIMQYPSNSFNCNNKDTMLRKYGNNRQIPLNTIVTSTDIKKIQDYYNC